MRGEGGGKDLASSIFMHSGEKSCPKRRQTTLDFSPKTACSTE